MTQRRLTPIGWMNLVGDSGAVAYRWVTMFLENWNVMAQQQQEAEFIEIYNHGTTKIELTGLHLSGASYAAPCCDVIYPSDYLLLRGGVGFTNKLFVNGVGQRDPRGFGVAGTICEGTQEPALALVLEWFPFSKGGPLYKGDNLVESSESGQAESAVPPTLGLFRAADGKQDTPRYRWNWRHRDAGGKGSSYETLFELARALNSDQSCAGDWQAAVIVSSGSRSWRPWVWQRLRSRRRRCGRSRPPVRWVPAPDCPGEFVGQCNDVLGETDWIDLPAVEIVWSVDHGQYLWVLGDPPPEGRRHRFYRVRLGP